MKDADMKAAELARDIMSRELVMYTTSKEEVITICNQLLASQARVRELTTWQPIATAPKDGTMVLLAGRDMYGDKDPGGPKWRIDKGWYDPAERRWYSGVLSSHFPPTHWRPLPAPPSDDAEGCDGTGHITSTDQRRYHIHRHGVRGSRA